jgi:hypothetical protein
LRWSDTARTQSIDFSRNSITGPVPDVFGLTELTFLNLDNNLFDYVPTYL